VACVEVVNREHGANVKITPRSLVAVFLVSCGLVGVADADTIPPEVKKVVTFIFVPDAQGKPTPNGTGFFASVKSDPPAPGLYGYLVTARHVLLKPDGTYYPKILVRLNKLQGDADFVGIDLTEDGHSTVYTHPDPTVDIAVIPAFPKESVYDFKVIPEEMLTTKESFSQLNIREGSDTFFVGLFLPYYGEQRNIPIVRFGRVAMLPDDRIPWKTDPAKPPQLVQTYLIDTRTYGGNSGSPVFFYLGSDRVPGSLILGAPLLKLAGIMEGHFNEPTPLNAVQTPDSAAYFSLYNNGIAAVTPSFLLHDILFSDELKKFRMEHPIPPPPPTK
jgi:hypothetical protein